MADVNVNFGLVLEIDGQEIALEPRTAINKIKDEPIEVGLPPGTEIRMNVAGGLQAFVEKISSAFGGPARIDWPTDLPAPLQQTVTYLTTLDLTINDFWVRFPAQKGADGKIAFVKPSDYRIGVYVSGATVDLFGSVKFKGFAVQIASGDGIRKP